MKEPMNQQLTEGLPAVTARILALKQQTAESVIELGKALIEAKRLCPHGEWTNYLESEVDFTPRTASSYMRIATCFGETKRKSISDLSATKLIELTSLSDKDREQALQMPDISTISVRELKSRLAAIKNREKTLREQVIDLFGRPQRESYFADPFDIEIDVLREIPDHDKLFPGRTGQQWVTFLQHIAKHGVMTPIMITRDNTVLSGYERIRAAKDLGFTTVPARYAPPLTEYGISKYAAENRSVDYVMMHHFIWSNWNGHNSEADYCMVLFAVMDGDEAEAERLYKHYMQTRESKDKENCNRLEELVKSSTVEDSIKKELIGLIDMQRWWERQS